MQQGKCKSEPRHDCRTSCTIPFWLMRLAMHSCITSIKQQKVRSTLFASSSRLPFRTKRLKTKDTGPTFDQPSILPLYYYTYVHYNYQYQVVWEHFCTSFRKERSMSGVRLLVGTR